MAYHLQDVIIENSEASTFSTAVQEWAITGFSVDDNCSSRCVCGKENIKYLFEITNMYNHVMLDPIGSKCIKKFGREDLSDEVDVCEQMAKLLDHVKTHKFIKFDSNLFSRKLLKYLYENDAFPKTQYNMNNPYRDYSFLLDMFNKKSEPSAKQQNKITALIMSAIIPFCKNKLNL